MARSLIKLARPHQWAKGAFVLLGPFYGLPDLLKRVEATGGTIWGIAWDVLIVVASFSLVSSGCYVFNDLADAAQDRAHPRKRLRPIACGDVTPRQASLYGLGLIAVGFVILGLLEGAVRPLVMVVMGLYVLNVQGYSMLFKRIVILDVVSLSAGFVLRVLGGCAAVGIGPTTWLLNVTFFLSMFLSFGKRLGERRTMGTGEAAATARAVQSVYTDELLRMAVVVTGVATLLTYAGYVQGKETTYQWGFNLLWLTVLPATYCLLRCIVLLENGAYDDPTELAVRDRPFQVGAVLFGLVTVGLIWWFRYQGVG
jgi:decaprenyl-phosphate phosphoribosyltransferase